MAKAPPLCAPRMAPFGPFATDSADSFLDLSPDPARDPTLLMIGNFLSNYSTSVGVCELIAARLKEAGWQVITTSHRLQRLSRLWDMVVTAWRTRSQYEVAHVDVFSGSAFFWAQLLCFELGLLRKPFVLTLHGGNLPNYARRFPSRVRRLLKRAYAITAPSNYLVQEMRPYREDIRLIPNPLDLHKYPFLLRDHPRPRLVWLRAFSAIYNPLMAGRVVSSLSDEFPDLHLDMIGPDKGDGSWDAFQKLLRDLRIEDHVTLAGKIPKQEVPARLNQGDIFVNTTDVDNTPVSVMEAMACGLCVVTTNVGGLSYLLQHERDALLVPPNDPLAMAHAVRRLLNEEGLAARLSANARQKAEQFDWSAVLPQWQRLFRSVAQEYLH